MPGVLVAFRKDLSPLILFLQARSPQATRPPTPPPVPEPSLTAPGATPHQLHSCPFEDAVCFSCLQFYHFLQENICLPITLIMPPGSSGEPCRRISPVFCLLYWENKQACLTYLHFPSRWTPRSKHRVALPSAPWT